MRHPASSGQASLPRSRPAQLASLVSAALLVTGAAAFGEGSYPSRAITLVTHSSPGAGGDLFLRQLAKHL